MITHHYMPNNMISILIIKGAMVTIMTNDMINTMTIVEAIITIITIMINTMINTMAIIEAIIIIITIMINTMTIVGAICNDGSVASYYADQAAYTPGQTIMVYLEVCIYISMYRASCIMYYICKIMMMNLTPLPEVQWCDHCES